MLSNTFWSFAYKMFFFLFKKKETIQNYNTAKVKEFLYIRTRTNRFFNTCQDITVFTFPNFSVIRNYLLRFGICVLCRFKHFIFLWNMYRTKKNIFMFFTTAIFLSLYCKFYFGWNNKTFYLRISSWLLFSVILSVERRKSLMWIIFYFTAIHRIHYKTQL